MRIFRYVKKTIIKNMKNYKRRLSIVFFFLLGIFLFATCKVNNTEDTLMLSFKNPPEKYRPGVYWYFMEGNMSRDGITKDLESMKTAGIGSVIFLEINVGVPRGNVKFMSKEWLSLLDYAITECERLGIEFIMGSGPGWAGSGGPWVKPEQSMRHLVAAKIDIKGPANFDDKLPVPEPRTPYFGEASLTPQLKKQWKDYYKDVCVLAFKTPGDNYILKDIDEKAFYFKPPFSSSHDAKPFLMPVKNSKAIKCGVIEKESTLDISDKLQSDGTLKWEVPEGKWTIMRFGMRNNGAVTRPAPIDALGFECDKFDTTAFNVHNREYVEKVYNATKPLDENSSGGWKRIHIDSWEMGAQNWSDNFRAEFKKRRGYDPIPYLPSYLGMIVKNVSFTERFLWDIRQTSNELIIENYARQFKRWGEKHDMLLSIEPYDMNPTSDFELGAVADIPMCEFWNKGYGFDTSYSCWESTSIAHIYGKEIVSAESFTSEWPDWNFYPGKLKNQSDWAFCMGINQLMYHTFAHQPFPDSVKPGMAMGPYGVHWDRGQTWWPMSIAYHKYVARCQLMLRKGRTKAEILYLTAEGAPYTFLVPPSALEGDTIVRDKRGYSFDCCSSEAIIKLAEVRDHKIIFPCGATYNVLVLPLINTMTPELAAKIEELLTKGAQIIGIPPVHSPSLEKYHYCDDMVRKIAIHIWGDLKVPDSEKIISYGEGKLYVGGIYSKSEGKTMFPSYDAACKVLKCLGIKEDFKSSGFIRYTHRITKERDIYFISNKSKNLINDVCVFNIAKGVPEFWNPVNGESRPVVEFKIKEGKTYIPVKLYPYESYFVVFNKNGKKYKCSPDKSNFPEAKQILDISSKWKLYFDPRWGGPGEVTFDKLTDWSKNDNKGIKYYSGVCRYYKNIKINDSINLEKVKTFFDVGKLKDIASVKINDKKVGVVWTDPMRIEITGYLKNGSNKIEIEVANLWVNRMIGDEQLPYDGIKDGKWPEWLLENKSRTSGRYTFSSRRPFNKDSSLKVSGLLGPVRITGIDVE